MSHNAPQKRPTTERIKRDVRTEMTGYIATTTPGRCYVCLTRVGGDPDLVEEFPDIDATIPVWVCDGCWHESLSADEREMLGLDG